jgi:dTDP-4-dehydrorhamnose reductase
VGVDLPGLDIRDADAVLARFRAERPAAVIHAAAMTDVDRCELEPELALSVNGEGTASVARAARSTGARLLYVSTDYVFAGRGDRPMRETDPVGPLSAYGRSKLAGERAVLSEEPGNAIVRTAWLFGRNGKNFVRTMLTLAAAGKPLRVVDDQFGSPTYTRDLASVLIELAERPAGGIFHATNSGQTTWFRFTREILRQAGRESSSLEPITSAELQRPAPRPSWSVLSLDRLKREGFGVPRPWEDALTAYLAEELTAACP